MSDQTDRPATAALEAQVEILREVLRDAKPEVDEGPDAPTSQPILDAYMGQVFEGITVVAPDGRSSLFTPGMEQITGYSAEEVNSISDLIQALAPDAETGAEQWAAFERGRGKAESDEELIEIVNKRGERRWLRGRLYRVNEDTLVHTLDITAIHTMRATTPYNAEHYQALLENLDVGIYSLSDPASGKISFCNAAARRMLGVPEESRDDLSSFMFYEDTADRVRLVAALMKGGWARSRTVRFEARLLRADDRRPVPIRFTTTGTYDDEGRMVRVDGAMEDMSERQAFEAERDEHELLISSLFHNTAVGISVGTVEGRILAVNPAYCAMVGYSSAELVGQTSDLVTHPDDHGLSVRMITEALAAGRDIVVFDKRYVHKDGHSFGVSATMAPVKDEQGQVVAGIGLFAPTGS
jgi:PAS domain S-box-containing protein